MNLIYLDHNASSPVAPEAVTAMQPWLAHCGNPTSTHAWGRQAAMAIEEARADLAALLGCAAEELFFTSGGTESDNLAILGLCDPARPAHLICSAIEHPAVLNTVGFLESRGWSVSRVGVDGQGVLKLAELEAALRADTRLVSVMLANNEVGSLQPVHEISRLVRARGIPLHSDAAQAVGKHRVKVDELGVDLLTVAGHKLNARVSSCSRCVTERLTNAACDRAPPLCWKSWAWARRPNDSRWPNPRFWKSMPACAIISSACCVRPCPPCASMPVGRHDWETPAVSHFRGSAAVT